MATFTMGMSKEKAPNELFNEGRQKVKILEMEYGKSKSNNDMFTTYIACLSNGATSNFYLVAEEGKRWLLKSLLEATGQYRKDENNNYVFDTDNIIGKVLEADIVNYDEEFIDTNGNSRTTKKSKIRKFFALGTTLSTDQEEVVTADNDEDIPF